MQTQDPAPLLAILREARPLAVSLPDIWKKIKGPVGVSVAHEQRDELCRLGYRVADVEVTREQTQDWGKEKRVVKVKMLAWRLDYDKEKGR